MRREEGVQTPILVLSVLRDPVPTYNLQDLHLEGYLSKRALLPSVVREKVVEVLKAKRDTSQHGALEQQLPTMGVKRETAPSRKPSGERG
jgi:hypothetical protein